MDEFEKYKNETEQDVKATLARIEAARRRECVDFDTYPVAGLHHEVSVAVSEALAMSEKPQVELSEPPAHVPQDFALGVFDVAKKIGEKPNEAAKKIADHLNSHKIESVSEAIAFGPFVNIEAKRDLLYGRILTNILELSERYGESNVNSNKTAVIDYSSPNIAKPIGIGHLRSTIIGESLGKIYEATGYSVVRDNHLGDWGTQFGTLIAAYKRWGDEKKIAADPIGELKNLYVRFSGEVKENPEMQDEAREYFARLEKRDPELIALWKRFRDLSIESFAGVYRRLGVNFDLNIGESYFIEQADKLVDECLDNGICKKDPESGAVVAEEIHGLPSFLLRKQDGSTLYHSRDLAAIDFRVKTFNPDILVYVVGQEQKLSFEQLFALADESGHLPKRVTAKHIDFGMVLADGKKMSTRGGTLIELDELLEKSVEKSLQILRGKNPETSEEELKATAEMLGVGAVMYNDLRQSRGKNISFDWDRMLDLEGGSAVYLQYTYARINSIFRKFFADGGTADFETLRPEDILFAEKQEFDLAKKLMFFPKAVLRAQRGDAPHIIAAYLEELTYLFNGFYGNVPILAAKDRKLRDSRLVLCRAVATVIKKALELLGIRTPEKM